MKSLFLDTTTSGETSSTQEGGEEASDSSVSIPIYAIVLLVATPVAMIPILITISILIYRRFFAPRKHKQCLKLVTTAIPFTMELPRLLHGTTVIKSFLFMPNVKYRSSSVVLWLETIQESSNHCCHNLAAQSVVCIMTSA